jgi:uncharacterized protein
LVIYDGGVFDDIKTGRRRQLSCGYGYTADMTPGEWQGQRYDGVMRNLIGNHVALTDEGRSGPDCAIVFADDAAVAGALPLQSYRRCGAHE